MFPDYIPLQVARTEHSLAMGLWPQRIHLPLVRIWGDIRSKHPVTALQLRQAMQ